MDGEEEEEEEEETPIVGRFHRGFGSLGDMGSFVGRFHRGFGSLGDMSSFDTDGRG
jgi:hypothetical protein